MIKVFCIEYCYNSMWHTPFSSTYPSIRCGLNGYEYLKKHGVQFVDHPKFADVLVTDRLLYPRRLLGLYPYRHISRYVTTLKLAWQYKTQKPILVWTDEPRYNQIFEQSFQHFWVIPNVYIMNLYAGGVYDCNLSCFGPTDPQSDHVQKLKYLTKADVEAYQQGHFTAFLGTYVYPSKSFLAAEFSYQGQELSLSLLRQQIACWGHQQGFVDIYGKEWPNNISRENSRFAPNWQGKKRSLLQPYQFNICMENTAYGFYCTEKIWDSISAYCLPIYSSGGNRIYDDFPKNSFIDVSLFNSIPELWDYIMTMPLDEYLERINCCIEVYNRCADEELQRAAYQRVLDRILSQLAVMTQQISKG